MKQNTVGTHWH